VESEAKGSLLPLRSPYVISFVLKAHGYVSGALSPPRPRVVKPWRALFKHPDDADKTVISRDGMATINPRYDQWFGWLMGYVDRDEPIRDDPYLAPKMSTMRTGSWPSNTEIAYDFCLWLPGMTTTSRHRLSRRTMGLLGPTIFSWTRRDGMSTGSKQAMLSRGYLLTA